MAIDVSKLASRAIELEKKSLQDITDITKGVILDDSGRRIVLPSVIQGFRDSELDFSYPPIDGTKKFRDLTTEWILGDNLEAAKQSHEMLSFATIGGTGAILMAFKFAQLYGYEVLLPDLGRPVYTDLANGALAYTRRYPLLNRNDRFNIEAVANIIQEDKQRFKGFLLVVNDPGQDPVGHTLTEEESQQIIDQANACNRLGGTRLAILWDVAYMSYSDARPTWLSRICQERDSFSSFICFSTGKSLACYGLRVGMILALLSKNSGELKTILFNTFAKTARQSYLIPDGVGMSAAVNVMSPQVLKNMRAEIAPLRTLLHERSVRMRKALADQNISYLPYDEGLFMTIAVNSNPELITKILKGKNIITTPMQPRYLRFSLASLPRGQEETIALKIREAEIEANSPGA